MVWRFRQIKPPKCRGTLVEAMWDSPNWIAEEKFDGDRRLAQFTGPRVRFTGTRESVDGTGFVERTDNLPHLNTGPKKLDGTVLDGEMIAPHALDMAGGKSKFVTSIMGSSPEEAIRKQMERGWLQYVVFDCLWYKGRDIRMLPLEERKEFLKPAVVEWGRKAMHACTATPRHTGKRKFFDLVLAAGGEGVVLKMLQSTYGQENMWVKVKGTKTADVVITGFTKGKGKYADQIGAVQFGQNQGVARAPQDKVWQLDLVACGQCSGIDDELRLDMSRNPRKYVGTVMEIKHYGREPSGKFRHPQFIRFRPDKNPADCRFDLEES